MNATSWTWNRDWSLFFLVTVFLHFSSPQEVGSLEVGIYYMAWFGNLTTVINQETKGRFEQRCSAFLFIVWTMHDYTDLPFPSFSIRSYSLNKCSNHFHCTAVQRKEGSGYMSISSFWMPCNLKKQPWQGSLFVDRQWPQTANRGTLLQYTFHFVCKLFKTISD